MARGATDILEKAIYDKSMNILLKLGFWVFITLIIIPRISLGSTFSYQGLNSTTRDHLVLRSHWLSWNSIQRDLFWPYPAETSKGSDYGVSATYRYGSSGAKDFTGNEFALRAGHFINPSFYVDAQVEVDRLQNQELEKSINFLTGEFNLYKIWPEVLYLHFKFQNDLTYERMFFPKSLDTFMREHGFDFRFLFTKIKNFRSSFRSEYRSFSDQNIRKYFDLDLKWRIGSQASWYWLGLGSEYYTYQHKKLGYWTPSEFKTLGPRFEMSQELFTNLRANLALNLNRFRDEFGVWGDGLYSNAGLEYGERGKQTIKVYYERIQSQQLGQQWYNDTIAMNLMSFF